MTWNRKIRHYAKHNIKTEQTITINPTGTEIPLPENTIETFYSLIGARYTDERILERAFSHFHFVGDDESRPDYVIQHDADHYSVCEFKKTSNERIEINKVEGTVKTHCERIIICHVQDDIILAFSDLIIPLAVCEQCNLTKRGEYPVGLSRAGITTIKRISIID